MNTREWSSEHFILFFKSTHSLFGAWSFLLVHIRFHLVKGPKTCMHPKCEYPTLLLMNVVSHTIEGLLNAIPHYKHRGIIKWVLINYPSTRLNIASSHCSLQYLYGLKIMCHLFLSINKCFSLTNVST
jgi:hypothetical protein